MHLTEVQSLAKQRPIDIALISVKSYDTIWACMMIAAVPVAGRLSSPPCRTASMRSASPRSSAGAARWASSSAAASASICMSPGHIRRGYAKRPDVTAFYVGEPTGRITRRAQELAAIMNDVDKAQATDNLWGERWTKLCVNGMRNGVSAATGMGGNERDRHDAIRRICIKLGSESVRVGQALGYKLGKIGVAAIRRSWRWPAKATAPHWTRSRSRCWRHRRKLARAVSAAVDGAGHGEGPAHRNRTDERLHRERRRARRRAGADA